MSRRDLKKDSYYDALNDSLITVEKTINLLRRLESNRLNIDESIVLKDISKSILDLELNLASLCILLRKMSENKFIELPTDLRRDMNSIIHSNRFDYEEDIIVYSQKGREEVDLSQLLLFCKDVLVNDK